MENQGQNGIFNTIYYGGNIRINGRFIGYFVIIQGVLKNELFDILVICYFGLQSTASISME